MVDIWKFLVCLSKSFYEDIPKYMIKFKNIASIVKLIMRMALLIYSWQIQELKQELQK